MATSPTPMRRDTPPPSEGFRLIPSSDPRKGEAAEATEGHAAEFGRFDAANDFAIGLIKSARELDDGHWMAELRDTAAAACQRLLESPDSRDLWRGLQLFLALQRQQIEFFRLEVELAKAGIEHVGRTRIAQLQAGLPDD